MDGLGDDFARSRLPKPLSQASSIYSKNPTEPSEATPSISEEPSYVTVRQAVSRGIVGHVPGFIHELYAIDEQLAKLSMKRKGRRRLYYGYCQDYLKFRPENDGVAGMSKKEVKQLLKRPINNYVLVPSEVAQDRKESGKQVLLDLHEIYQHLKKQMDKEFNRRVFFSASMNLTNFDEWRATEEHLLLKRNFIEIEDESEEEPEEEILQSSYSLRREKMSAEKSILDVLRPPVSRSTQEIMSRVSPERSELDIVLASRKWSDSSVLLAQSDEQFAEESSEDTTSSGDDEVDDEMLPEFGLFRADRLTSPDYRIARERSALNVLVPSRQFVLSEAGSICSNRSKSTTTSSITSSGESSGSNPDKDVIEQIAKVFSHKGSTASNACIDSRRSNYSDVNFLDLNSRYIFNLLGQPKTKVEDLVCSTICDLENSMPELSSSNSCDCSDLCDDDDDDSYDYSYDESDEESDDEFDTEADDEFDDESGDVIDQTPDDVHVDYPGKQDVHYDDDADVCIIKRKTCFQCQPT